MSVAQSDKINLNGLKTLNDPEYDDRSYNSKGDKAAYLHGRKPKKIRFFANGDKFFQGKKISVHLHKYQCIDELQTELTNKMPPQVYLPNGIRQIFSSTSGRKITDLDQLETGRDYVCAGNETFKSIAYGQNPRDPWFKGRPQRLSRYPQLIPFGFGALQSISQNSESNGYHKLDNQSNYVGQNAFPTRFYRPTGPSFLSKNVIGHFPEHGSSVAYPKLIKFRSKGTDNQNSSYYQELLTQQVKPKVITVVKGVSETPKSFVRILLNKRSVASYETLVSDIETSLRDQSQQKMTEISHIYNLFGKEIKSVADFFKSNDFFIAIGDHDQLGHKQVKEILDDMYPEHPQTEQILQYWGVKKLEVSLGKENIREPDRPQNLHGSNISVDKRDSGFEEQDFSKESDFAANSNILVDKESNILPKPKLSKSRPFISRKKKEPPRNNVLTQSIPKVIESESVNIEKTMGRHSPATYRRIMQERNAERLHIAYEEREKARIMIQEQLKTERKRIEDYSMNNSAVYSQYVRKSINDKGSIDVFKKMDESSLESRKQKMRQKLEKSNQQINPNSTYQADSATSVFIKEKREGEELPFIEPVSSVTVSSRLNHRDPEPTSPVQTELQPLYNQGSHSPPRKLNKIQEASNENNVEDQNSSIDESVTKPKNSVTEKPRRKAVKSRRKSQDMQYPRNNRNIKDIRENESEVSLSPQRPPRSDVTIEGNINGSIVLKEERKTEQHAELVEETAKSQSLVKSDTPPKPHQDPSPTKFTSNVIVKQSSQTNLDTVLKPKTPNNLESDLKVTGDHNTTMNEPTPDKEPESIIKTSNEKLSSPVQKKTVQLVVPGNRVMGKLCRQISSPQIVYQRFDTSKILGDGNFAVVKMAVLKENKREYALKIIDKSKMRGKESMIENEIWIMKLCNHENIIKLKEEYESKEEVFLVMELIKGGDLFDAITQSVKFNEPVAAKMVVDMANALFYLHSRRVVHRDLKPENLMVLRHRDGSITLKLADFGLAMEVKKLIYTVCGTPTYVAPEILTEQGYSLEVDLWALGVITYILLCGFPPFRSPKKDQDQLFEFIKSGNFEFVSPYWDKISYDVKDLISKLLVVDRRQRYTTIQVLSHKWIVSKGSSTQVSDEVKRGRTAQLEEEAKMNLEDFQRKKKELRQTINREIQAAYSSQSK